MTDDNKTNVDDLSSDVDLNIGEVNNATEEITDVDAKVNISSLKKDFDPNFLNTDQVEEYENKMAKLTKLQKMSYMDKVNSFDKKEFSPRSILLSIVVIYLTWFLIPDYIYKKYLWNPIRLEKLGVMGKEILLKLIALLRLAGPVLVYYFYKKFPLMHNSKYEVSVDYQFIHGPREITYTSMLERVKVKWDDIADVKYDNKHRINHIRCLGKNGKDLLAIRLDVKSFDKLKKLVVEYTDKNHPLNKIFC